MNGSLQTRHILRETNQPGSQVKLREDDDDHDDHEVYLDKAALVDEVTYGLEVGAAVGDVGLCKLCPNVLLALTQRGCLAMWDQGRIFCSESMPRKKDFEMILEENIIVCPL